MIFDNSNPSLELMAEGSFETDIVIKNNRKFEQLKRIISK